MEFALDDDLRRAILDGQRTCRLQNLSTKLNPTQGLALRKMKPILNQTLIHQWLAEGIHNELRLG